MESVRKTRQNVAQLENWVDQAVMSFVIDMKYKLRLNNHKGHWQEYDGPYLVRRLEDELNELKAAQQECAKKGIDGKRLLAVVHECADIANFAMMMADNAKRQMQLEEKMRT